jgi:hypothetical protein
MHTQYRPQTPDTRHYAAASPGTGKSHLAVALGVEAVKAGSSVYFATLADIVGTLAKAEREGQLRERIHWFCRAALLIVDEIGYLPVVQGGGNLFFQLVNARYEKAAMILTSNRGFAEWGEVFGDPVVATALLDRLLHHAVVHSDRRLQLPAAPARRSDARAPPLQSAHQPLNPAADAAPPRTPAKITPVRPTRRLNDKLRNVTSAQMRKVHSA